jgi:hypothetical protein
MAAVYGIDNNVSHFIVKTQKNYEFVGRFAVTTEEGVHFWLVSSGR